MFETEYVCVLLVGDGVERRSGPIIELDRNTEGAEVSISTEACSVNSETFCCVPGGSLDSK
jgi:hypothetical protein